MTTLLPPTAIEVSNLTKSFGVKRVLENVSFSIPRGTVFALLGPNGAGKTTIVHILTTALRADGGSIRIAGMDPRQNGHDVRSLIGVTGQFAAIDDYRTGRENMMLMAELNHLPRNERRDRIDNLLDQFDLVDAADRLPSTYSGGMRRRLDIAMTLVGDPRILFLDEPTTGLDPKSRRDTWEIVRNLLRNGITVFLTTQYLEEADQLADNIAILNRGKIVASGTPAELKRAVPGGYIVLEFPDVESRDAAAVIIGGVIEGESPQLRVPSDGSIGDLRSTLAHVDEHDISVERVTTEQPDLDHVFLELTGGSSARKGLEQ